MEALIATIVPSIILLIAALASIWLNKILGKYGDKNDEDE